MKAIEIKNLQFKIKQTEILKNISFEVERGDIFGLIGHNGAGKTSLLKILLGLTVNYQGSIRLFESEDLSRERAGIGVVMGSLGVDENITAKQYIHRVCYMLGVSGKENERILLEKVGLHNVLGKKIKTFSYGMKRRLSVAVALAGTPKLLILDEPFNGIDPNGMAEIRLLLQQLSQDGMTILITSHIISELLKLSTTYGVMYKGTFQGIYTKEFLNSFNLDKTIFKIEGSLSDSLEIISVKYPQLYCNSDILGEISVFGDIPKEFYKENAASLHVISHEKAREEEILFWIMNGFGK